MVGDQKKFRSPEELARGKYESDLYIKTLEKRLDEMRADYLQAREENMAKAKLEDLIDQISKRQESPSSYEPPAKEDKMPFDPNQIESLVETHIGKYETQRQEQANFNMVKEKLKERYGIRYQDHLKEHIDDLGLTQDYVNDLAKKSPKALLKTLGLDEAPQRDPFQAPVRSSQRTDSFAPKTLQRTWSYYQNLKKTDPKLYSNPKTTIQMHKDYAELGAKFEDGDFNAV